MVNKSYYKFIISIGTACFLFIAISFIYKYYNTYYAENTSFQAEKIYINI